MNIEINIKQHMTIIKPEYHHDSLLVSPIKYFY